MKLVLIRALRFEVYVSFNVQKKRMEFSQEIMHVQGSTLTFFPTSDQYIYMFKL